MPGLRQDAHPAHSEAEAGGGGEPPVTRAARAWSRAARRPRPLRRAPRGSAAAGAAAAGRRRAAPLLRGTVEPPRRRRRRASWAAYAAPSRGLGGRVLESGLASFFLAGARFFGLALVGGGGGGGWNSSTVLHRLRLACAFIEPRKSLRKILRPLRAMKLAASSTHRSTNPSSALFITTPASLLALPTSSCSF